MKILTLLDMSLIHQFSYYSNTKKLYRANSCLREVRKMKDLKEWPFEPLGDPEINPCGEGPGAGPGFPG